MKVKRSKSVDLGPAAALSGGLVVLACAAAAATTTGDGFIPRVPTIDALAGLAVGAFFVDRLVTFVPPWPARHDKKAHRAADLDALRFGWGAAFGALFVLVTGLGAVAALTSTDAVDSRVDRVIAVLAIAGGVRGLTRFKEALNPPDVVSEAKKNEGAQDEQAGSGAYVFGLGGLLLACVIAVVAHGDQNGLELLGDDKQADGTIELVVRFGPLLVAAVVVQQLIEHLVGVHITGAAKKAITAAISVVLGVVAARLLDLYLLHNLGFFHGPSTDTSLAAALGHSTDAQRFFDVMVTGLVIAAGTTSLHDLAAGLRRSAS